MNKSDAVHDYIRKLLGGRIFLGRYQERRHVKVLQQYRDVIMVDEAEDDFIQDLELIRDNCRKKLGFYKWVGITYPDFPGTPSAYCLWVELNNMPFGLYWFQVKSVQVTDQGNGEIIIRLKSIRYLNDSEADNLVNKKGSNSNKGNLSNTTSSSNSTANSHPGENPITKFGEVLKKELSEFIRDLSFLKLIEAVKLFTAAFITITVYTFMFIGYVGEYFLRLLHELSVLLKTITPIIHHIIEALAKCVGGLYLLLAMIWRDSTKSPATGHSLPALTDNSPVYKFRHEVRPRSTFVNIKNKRLS